MGRWPKGCGSSARTTRKVPSGGRSVEGIGYVFIGDGKVRCRKCDAEVPMARWWLHGTQEDPHRRLVS